MVSISPRDPPPTVPLSLKRLVCLFFFLVISVHQMGAVCCRPAVSHPSSRPRPRPCPISFRSPSTLKETLISSTLSCCDASVKAHSERYSLPPPFCFPTYPTLLGPNGPTQTNPRALCPQVHQQVKVCKDESCRQYHTRAATS